MPVTLSQAALHLNARRVAALAEAAGLSLVVALKTSFVRPPVLAALRSAVEAPYCIFSTEALAMLPELAREDLEFVGLAVPRAYADIVPRCRASLHTSPETIMAAHAAAASTAMPHGIWLGYRTSDDREGLYPETLLGAIGGYAGLCRAPLYLAGLLANWGCAVERPPGCSEIDRLLDAADAFDTATGGTPVSVSVGGSVLLPALSRVRKRRASIRLRIGEAMMAGTIPGGSGVDIDLERPFSLAAKVVEVQAVTDRPQWRRVLLDRGTLDLEPGDCQIEGWHGRLIRGSTELTMAELEHAEGTDMLGRSVTIKLGFKSAVRALGRSPLLRLADDPPVLVAERGRAARFNRI